MGPCTLTTLFGARAKGGGNYSGQRVKRFVIYALPEHAPRGEACEKREGDGRKGDKRRRRAWPHRTKHLQQAGGQPCQGQVAADPQAQQNAGRQPRDGQPSQRRAAAHPQAQQKASRQPKPAPARAQAVPKPRTAAQLARRQRSLIRLQQKHLARALARERTAHGLRVWCARARVALRRRTALEMPRSPIQEVRVASW